MDSRLFIKEAAALVKEIEDNRLVESFRDYNSGGNNSRGKIQKDLNRVFAGLQNPTLPSAYRLRDVAIDAGYSVDQQVINRLEHGEACW